MLTEAEAKKQNLPGSHVFIRTQLAYKNEIDRDALIVHLNGEAYKAFIDTISIGQFPLLKKENDIVLKTGHFGTSASTIMRKVECFYLDNLKIAAAFELHLKACLLAHDIVIHLINNKVSSFNAAPFKALRKKQDQEPVMKHELLAIEGFYYNGEHNILRGLTSQSLSFEKILNEPYRSMLGKSEDFLNIVEDYRNLRNQIHLPGDIVEAPHLAKYTGYSLIEVLERFINEEIVVYNNHLIAKWNLHTANNLAPLNLSKVI